MKARTLFELMAASPPPTQAGRRGKPGFFGRHRIGSHGPHQNRALAMALGKTPPMASPAAPPAPAKPATVPKPDTSPGPAKPAEPGRPGQAPRHPNPYIRPHIDPNIDPAPAKARREESLAKKYIRSL